jgi:scyllo-inositol 2-dehydrogenase (NADP+)
MNESTALVRMAVIGLGWVANHRHIPCILRHPEAALVGVVDRHKGKVAALKSRYKALKTAVSEDGSASWLDEVDAVVIATHPTAHFQLAKAAMERGKHVLVEKPFTLQPEEASELLELSARTGRVCAVSHNFLFADSIRKLDHLIQTGELGQITGIEGVQMSNPRRRLPTWYNDLPLGLFYDESPHLMYLVRHFAGCNLNLAASHVIPSQADGATPYGISLSYQGASFPIRISMLFSSPLSEWHLMVMGTRKIAIADIFRDVLVVAENDGAHTASQILKTSFSACSSHFMGSLYSGLRLVSGQLYYGTMQVYDRFLDAILAQKALLDIRAEDGCEIVRMQHAILDRCHPQA